MDLDSLITLDSGVFLACLLGLPPQEGGDFPHGFGAVDPFPFEV